MLVGDWVNLPRTNLGPLTTTFILPDSCTVNYVKCTTCSVAWQGQFCNVTEPSDTTSCWPQATAGMVSPLAPFLGWGFFSPGIVCPAGYSTACSATKGPSGISAAWDVEFSMLQGETAIGCCPTGYTCGNNYGNTCFIEATATTISTAVCSSGSSHIGARTIPDQNLGISTFTLFAPMYQLNWQSADRLGGTGAHVTRTESAGTNTTSGSQTGFDAANQSDSSSGSTSGLSNAASAGIGIASTVVALAITGAVFLLWRRRRRDAAAARLLQSANTQPQQTQGYQEHLAQKAELPSQNYYYEISSESTGRSPVEMPTDRVFEK